MNVSHVCISHLKFTGGIYMNHKNVELHVQWLPKHMESHNKVVAKDSHEKQSPKLVTKLQS